MTPRFPPFLRRPLPQLVAIVAAFCVGVGMMISLGLSGAVAGAEESAGSAEEKKAVEAVAYEYLGYLASGDAVSLQQMISRADADAHKDECSDLMAPDVFSGAIEHISDVEIVKITLDDPWEIYTVDFTYVLDSVDYYSSLQIDYYNDGWYPAPVEQLVRLSYGSDSDLRDFRVSDVDISLGDKITSCDLAVYPGVYQFDPPAHGYIAGDPVKLSIPLGETNSTYSNLISYQQPVTEIPTGFTLSDTLQQAIQTVFSAWVDSCLTEEGIFNSSLTYTCPNMQSYGYSEVSDLAITSIKYPTVYRVAPVENAFYFEASEGFYSMSFSGISRSPENPSAVPAPVETSERIRSRTYSAKIVNGEIILE